MSNLKKILKNESEHVGLVCGAMFGVLVVMNVGILNFFVACINELPNTPESLPKVNILLFIMGLVMFIVDIVAFICATRLNLWAAVFRDSSLMVASFGNSIISLMALYTAVFSDIFSSNKVNDLRSINRFFLMINGNAFEYGVVIFALTSAIGVYSNFLHPIFDKRFRKNNHIGSVLPKKNDNLIVDNQVKISAHKDEKQESKLEGVLEGVILAVSTLAIIGCVLSMLRLKE